MSSYWAMTSCVRPNRWPLNQSISRWRADRISVSLNPIPDLLRPFTSGQNDNPIRPAHRLFSSLLSQTDLDRTKGQLHPRSNQMISVKDLNPAVIKAQYAVRGQIALKGEELRLRLAQDPKAKDELGFDTVIGCNIGNPQQLGQKPLTFMRQVACSTEYPELLNRPEATSIFPSDVIDRARSLLDAVGSIGAYSHSKGVPLIRHHVAEFLGERDGFPADPETIYLTTGASTGVSNIMQLILSSPNDGVMIPIPQYPLYTAVLALNNAKPVEYYLSETDDWAPDLESLECTLETATTNGIRTRAMVVISPGNPVGNCLSRQAMESIVQFCHRHQLILLADEVYQNNIFDKVHRPFISFKHILRSMPSPISQELGLISFHSISKGQTGECGRRGGFFELVNIPQEVQEQIYKIASIQLCPPLAGQIGVDLLVKPPRQGDPSYEIWSNEVQTIQESLKNRSQLLAESFNRLEGMSCNEAQGAMYLFPKLDLPKKVYEMAKSKGQSADEFYCMELLLKTGICIIPGSGFGQVPGTMHFRTTFLAPGVEDYIKKFKKFHVDFMNQFKD